MDSTLFICIYLQQQDTLEVFLLLNKQLNLALSVGVGSVLNSKYVHISKGFDNQTDLPVSGVGGQLSLAASTRMEIIQQSE